MQQNIATSKQLFKIAEVVLKKMKNSKWLLFLPLLLLSCYSVRADQQIIGIAIAKNDHVYVWFADCTVTSGTSDNFEEYKYAHAYSLPPGKTIKDIIAISIAGSNDYVYTNYSSSKYTLFLQKEIYFNQLLTLPGDDTPTNFYTHLQNH